MRPFCVSAERSARISTVERFKNCGRRSISSKMTTSVLHAHPTDLHLHSAGTITEELPPEQDCEFEEGNIDNDPCYRESPRCLSRHSAIKHDLSPSTIRRGSFPTERPTSASTKDPGNQKTAVRQSLSLNTSPRVHYGIPLGTPAAKEAARSFWSMDMLQQSLKKIATYTAESGYNSPTLSRPESPSFSSLGGSSIAADDSVDNFRLPCLAVSAPPSPQSIQRKYDTESSVPRLHPLSASTSPFMAAKKGNKGRVEDPRRARSYPYSASSASPLPRSTPPFLSPGVTRKISVRSSSSKPLYKRLLPLSVEGKQLKLSRKLMPLRKSNSFNSYLQPHSMYGSCSTTREYCHSSSLTSDNGFYE